MSVQIGELFVNVRMSLNDFKKDTDNVNKQIKQLSTEFRKFGTELTRIGSLARNTGLAITGAFGSAFAIARKDMPALNQELMNIQNSFKEVAISVSQAVLPAVQDFSKALQGSVGAIQDWISRNREFLTSLLKIGVALLVFGQTVKIIGDLSKGISALVSLLNRAADVFLLFFTNPLTWAVLLLATLVLIEDQIKSIHGALKAFSGAGGVSLGSALFGGKIGPNQASALQDIKDKFGSLFDELQKKFPQIAQLFKLNFDQPMTKTRDLAGQFVEGVRSQFKDLSDNMQEFGKSVASALDNAFGETIFQAITGRLHGLRSILLSFRDDIARAFSRGISNTILGGIFGTAQGGQGIFGSTPFGGIASKLGSFMGFGGGAPGQGGGNQTAAQQADTEATKQHTQEITSATQNLQMFQQAKDQVITNFGVLSSTLQNTSNNVTQSMNSILQSHMQTATGVAAGWAQAIATVNAAADALLARFGGGKGGGGGGFLGFFKSAVSLATNIFGGGGGNPIGSITKVLSNIGLAEGGVVTKPQLRLVGEAGPEAIVPLDKAGQMGGVNVTINSDIVLADDQSSVDRFVRQIKEGLKRASTRQTGGTAIAF